jgi:hypothetical protein
MKLIALSFVLFIVTSNSALAHDYSPQECPVVGNTHSGIYHTAGGHSYAKMLRLNHSGDNRRCFKSTQEAQKAGFRAARR